MTARLGRGRGGFAAAQEEYLSSMPGTAPQSGGFAPTGDLQPPPPPPTFANLSINKEAPVRMKPQPPTGFTMEPQPPTGFTMGPPPTSTVEGSYWAPPPAAGGWNTAPPQQPPSDGWNIAPPQQPPSDGWNVAPAPVPQIPTDGWAPAMAPNKPPQETQNKGVEFIGEWNDGSSTGGKEDAVSAEEQVLMRNMIKKKMGLIQTTADLEVIRQDPNSVLSSVRTFEELNLSEALRKGIYGMGFSRPSKIQEFALPLLLADPPRNMIAQSQSGTGKTAAFVLTMLTKVVATEKYPQCLCLAPTYELARQIGEVAEEMARFLPDISIGYAVRGTRDYSDRSPITDQIVIGTPGTMLDWALKLRLFDPKKVIVFVLDEADYMIAQQGHQTQSQRIRNALSPTVQILLFSATYTEELWKFAHQMVPDPTVCRLKQEDLALDNIKQCYIECRDDMAKYRAICDIYGSLSIGQSIIFCRTREAAATLARRMKEDGHSVGMLSGELSIEERVNVIERFRDAKERVLISTNVVARGLDIQQVTVVVNFDLPTTLKGDPDYETYLHRIGRTGRFGRVGLAFNMVQNDRDMKTVQLIATHFGRPITRMDTSQDQELNSLKNS